MQIHRVQNPGAEDGAREGSDEVIRSRIRPEHFGDGEEAEDEEYWQGRDALEDPEGAQELLAQGSRRCSAVVRHGVFEVLGMWEDAMVRSQRTSTSDTLKRGDGIVVNVEFQKEPNSDKCFQCFVLDVGSLYVLFV